MLFIFQYQVSTAVMEFVAVLSSLYLCLRSCVFDATVFSVNKDLYITFMSLFCKLKFTTKATVNDFFYI